MHIRLSKLLKVGLPNAKYDSKRRLGEGYTSVDWGNDSEIKEAMAVDNNKDDDEEDS